MKSLAFIVLFCCCFAVQAQTNWKLSTEKDGIQIYTGILPNSKLKAVRVLCTVDATATQITALIIDVNSGADWVYETKSSYLLKQVSPTELYYYSEVNLPWPLENRDFISYLKVHQNPLSKVVTIDGPVEADFIPEKKGVVRIRSSVGKWIITPLAASKSKIEYTIQVDPGGSIPTWLINLFATEGPLHVIQKLKIQVELPKYRNAVLPFIVK